jgi:hypothetical protein
MADISKNERAKVVLDEDTATCNCMTPQAVQDVAIRHDGYMIVTQEWNLLGGSSHLVSGL